jgi:hypothetical protein
MGQRELQRRIGQPDAMHGAHRFNGADRGGHNDRLAAGPLQRLPQRRADA